MKHSIFVCLAALVLAGCVTTGGKKLNLSGISKGQSTKEDVIDALGDPDQEVALDDGRTVCTWVSVRKSENFLLSGLTDRGIDNTSEREKNATIAEEITTVQITFSAKGIVQQITKSKTGHLAK